jgi:pretoxin HINT domain-containing protein
VEALACATEASSPAARAHRLKGPNFRAETGGLELAYRWSRARARGNPEKVMTLGTRRFEKRSASLLLASTRGATMLQYIVVLGLVALTGAVAFAQFNDSIRSALQGETQAVAESNREAGGPVGSLGEEVALAGGKALVVQGSWALSSKAGRVGAAAARRKQRGRANSQFKGGQTDRGTPVSGGCSNGICSEDDGQSCFAAGTPVATPNGPMSIERIVPGDLVLSRDEETGNFSTQRVSATFITLDRQLTDVHTVSLSGDKGTVRVTPGHLFWTPTDTWLPAEELVPGAVLVDSSGAEVSVVSVAPVRAPANVYNLEVEGTHTYFAGATPVWVHNGSCGSKRDKNHPDAADDSDPGTTDPPPGQSQNPPGQNQNPPGQNQNPPGQNQNPPGQNQNPPGQNQNPPGQSQQSPNKYAEPEVVAYINRTIEAQNELLQKAYDIDLNGKTAAQRNANIDAQIDRVRRGKGDYDDYSPVEKEQEIARLEGRRVPPSAPQVPSITSLDQAAAESSKSCKDVPCNQFGSDLLTRAGGGNPGRPHDGPIEPNQLVQVSLHFPNSGNNHLYNVYFDDTGHAYVIQSYLNHEVPIVNKMTQADYQSLYDKATSGKDGWADAYKTLFGVNPVVNGTDPADNRPNEVWLNDPAPPTP